MGMTTNESLQLNHFKVDITTESPPPSIGNIGLDVVETVSTEEANSQHLTASPHCLRNTMNIANAKKRDSLI